MGCGSSTVGVAGTNEHTQTVHKGGGDVNKNHHAVNGVKAKQQQHKQEDRNKTIDSNANNVIPVNMTPVKKPVAFDVSLDGQNTEILLNRKPRRLQTLEPLNVPRFSAEQLAEKQRQAEEKREKMRQKRMSASKKSSRRRQELMRAKEFEMEQQLQQEKALDDHLKQAELKREARLKEIQEKQRIRDERARRARERAKKLNAEPQEDTFDVEKDEQFNASDVDSWLGDDDRTTGFGDENSADERIGSGPQKKVREKSGRVRTVASASTVDSYDAAFQRQPHHTKTHSFNAEQNDDDDFFG
ncbi:hypothetical protein BaRGS_00001783 [Batillaria attramentaria]|uniref:Uncharacterized protein n=1 Tax=Batillaria attramentaria TaxID=370345 RepID=A0ABD0M600_9CAEN